MDKNKSPLLFLHGSLGTAKDMEPLMALMQERGYQTLSFDFSGHGGGKTLPSEFRIDYFARDLEDYLKRHEVKEVSVFGHSMGGYVGIYHKANFEDSPISNIITYGTKFNWSESAVNKELPMLVPEHVEERFPAWAFSLKEKHGEAWKHLLRSTAHMMQNLERLDGLMKEDVEDMQIPVTFVLGDQDRMVTVEETRMMSSWIRHSSVKILAHSKHELEKSNLRELASLLDEAMRAP